MRRIPGGFWTRWAKPNPNPNPNPNRKPNPNPNPNAYQVGKQVGKIIGSSTSVDANASICVSDTAGQSLILQIENTEGRGGQRSIVVYCPFWVLNTSQYAIRLRADGEESLPAGSVSDQLDGSRAMTGSTYDLHKEAAQAKADTTMATNGDLEV